MSTEPIELIAKTTGRVIGFVCGKCGCTEHMMFVGTYLGTDEERLEGARCAAVEHCGPRFCACGAERKRHHDVCDDCRHRQWAKEHEEKEHAAFEKAEKVPASEWTGEHVWSDRFECIFDDIDELLERHNDHDEEPPEYVWECNEVRLTLDASDILSQELESQEAWEGIRDQISAADEYELQALLDGWLAKRKLRWWVEGGSLAVLLPTTRPAVPT
jgi:hypothetical protein